MNKSKYKYLFDIDSPDDLRILPETALDAVCVEIREYLIDTITKISGHLGAGLGVVELAVALHYVYNTPLDKIIFDTGHQAYPHKILTGRRDLLSTIRQKGGLSGFLKRSESEYDAFGAGHASTSISSGLGIAVARDILKKDFRVVSIIGDGAMTCGLAYEAMNNCGFQNRDITVILNDNNVSISKNVSSFSNYFNELYTKESVQKLRNNIWDMTGKFDNIGDRIRRLAAKLEDGVKAIVTPGSLFEALGFKYFGPINGNNVHKLVKVFRVIRNMKGPIFLHIMTQKGKGYQLAEEDQFFLHAVGKIDKSTGQSLFPVKNEDKVPLYQDVFGEAMVELCQMNSKIVAVTAAMSDGTGLDILKKEMPDRVIDVGIAEGHAVTFSAGLATEGIIPVVAIYSSFLQRAYDNIFHDCALQNLHVVFAIDRAGVVGEDGATHHGFMDLAYLRTIPNMVVMAPKDRQELRNMLYSAIFYYTHSPVAIRYPRGKSSGTQIEQFRLIELGKAEILRKGTDVAILAIGKTVYESQLAAEILSEQGIEAEIINARFVKPIDEKMIDYICIKFEKIITIEDGFVNGGFGSAVLEYAANKNYKNQFLLHGIHHTIEHATQAQLYEELLLDSKGIASKVIDLIGKYNLNEQDIAINSSILENSNELS
ncbi:MAG: 1-deoxy-D-xylulose-5-phosphate synthase [Candidatus Kapabacteria bacterium]|nr:1-deoxy-D-xylulose-5-phosphate synthase [Candidatus Kapabacteria bacterium]